MIADKLACVNGLRAANFRVAPPSGFDRGHEPAVRGVTSARRIGFHFVKSERAGTQWIWSVPPRKSGPHLSTGEVDRLLAEGEKLRRRSAELAREATEIERRLAELYGSGSMSDRRKSDRRKKWPRLRGK